MLQTKSRKTTGVFPFWHDQKEHGGISQVTSTNGEVASSEANATKWCSLAAFLLQHLFDLKYQCTNKQPRERSAVSKKQVKQQIRTKFLYHCRPYLQHHCDTTSYSSYRYFYVSSHGSLQVCSTWSTCTVWVCRVRSRTPGNTKHHPTTQINNLDRSSGPEARKVSNQFQRSFKKPIFNATTFIKISNVKASRPGTIARRKRTKDDSTWCPMIGKLLFLPLQMVASQAATPKRYSLVCVKSL